MNGSRTDAVPATGSGSPLSFLRCAGLLAGILALIVGILGMHILAGSHSMPAPAAAAASSEGTSHLVGARHAGQMAAAAPAADVAAPQSGNDSLAQSCSCPAKCSNMAAPCAPSALPGSLSAPLPGTAVFAVRVRAGAPAAPTGHWAYLPGSPSPGELSISRT
jgi:hypothetical protein